MHDQRSERILTWETCNYGGGCDTANYSRLSCTDVTRQKQLIYGLLLLLSARPELSCKYCKKGSNRIGVPDGRDKIYMSPTARYSTVVSQRQPPDDFNLRASGYLSSTGYSRIRAARAAAFPSLDNFDWPSPSSSLHARNLVCSASD
jgi:hypothetical protein